MADATSVPLWFSGATFFGGLISSQFLELLKDQRSSKREKEARAYVQRATNIERRAQFQRESLVELQQVSYEIMRSLTDIITHHSVQLKMGQYRSIQPALEAYGIQQNSMWRFSLLYSRIRDTEAAGCCEVFAAIAASYNEAFTLKQLDEFSGRLRDKYKALIRRIGVVLKEIDDVDVLI